MHFVFILLSFQYWHLFCFLCCGYFLADRTAKTFSLICSFSWVYFHSVHKLFSIHLSLLKHFLDIFRLFFHHPFSIICFFIFNNSVTWKCTCCRGLVVRYVPQQQTYALKRNLRWVWNVKNSERFYTEYKNLPKKINILFRIKSQKISNSQPPYYVVYVIQYNITELAHWNIWSNMQILCTVLMPMK